jgi:uncharacterized protein
VPELVEDHPERSRYEIEVDGERGGFVQYRRSGRELTLIHTETDPRFRGRGLAGHLIAAVLDEARRHGVAVIPLCPFVRSFIADHPGYADLVPAARHAEFGI